MGPEQAVSARDGDSHDMDFTVANLRRKQIIQAARAAIAEGGVDKLTLRNVAERAQVSHATIAYYFHSRRELIDSALLEISKEFMIGLRQRHLVYGTKDLFDLADTFLDPANASARFVVQMIDSGLHDPELRRTHDEFIGYGRERIERSIRVGMQEGGLRDDIDPVVAAALLHGVLIWWEAELCNLATSKEFAHTVAQLMLKLLSPGSGERSSTDSADVRGVNGDNPGSWARPSTLDVIQASVLNDPELSPETAADLADIYRRLYHLAAKASRATPAQ